MSYNGYLLKMGADVFPLSFVYANSYTVTPNRRQDLDSARNADGVLERNVLEHTATTISFQTKPMWNSEMNQMMTFIRNHYSVELEKKISMEYYCPDLDDYKTGEFYIPDIAFSINMVDNEHNRILYNGFQLEFIEY
jgi:hypothetical protein